jgi:nucleoside-diphosphate-sugar epimerase
MPRIAVLGANGQVGAELCLLLSKVPGIQLVPVCRNPTGSAFLRYSGIACRHGRIADEKEASQLIGDCDVIVNCALGVGTPREVRNVDRALLRNAFAHSGRGAVIIHFSTVMVHGDPREGRLLRWRDAYGRAKRAAENHVQRESSRTGKVGYTLRLGHVCGPLQNITDKIRKEISDGKALLFEHDRPSNTVYTVTIVDAIRSILAGKEQPGEYDLTNYPQWTWRQVYAYEAAECNVPYAPGIVVDRKPGGVFAGAAAQVRALAAGWLRTAWVRRALDRWLAVSPASLNARAQATWYRLRARAEIGELTRQAMPAPELSWIDLSRRPLVSLQPTEQLLSGDPYASLAEVRKRWPRDLEGHLAESAAALEQPSTV